MILRCAALIMVVALACPAQSQRRADRSVAGRPRSSIQFADVTKQAGIDFHLTCGTKDKLYIMDAMCGGIAFFDYDNDGWSDIFLLNGSTLAQLASGTSPPSKLYHNERNGTFRDVTATIGVDHRGWGMGVAAGDFDQDGFVDLYLTYLDHAVLYKNDGGKRFVDVTAQAGVANAGRWGTSAAWGDYDNDGDLDLYVANYVDLDLHALPKFGSGPFCQYRGIKVSCGPRGLKGSRDRLYRNLGNGRFEDVTATSNIDPDSFYGLGVMWLDYNNDGCLDAYVANDSSPSLLYRGNCRGALIETAVAAGVAYSADGMEQAGMGIDAADFDGDGDLDIAKINFSDDVNNLYRNDGNGEFTDVTGPSGFGPVSKPFLGFGVKFADFDNDGWPDVFVANGHVNPQVDGKKFGVTYAERNLVFKNGGHGEFKEVGLMAGPALKIPRVGRGLATADFDHDGRIDVLVSNLDGGALLLRNVSTGTNNWIAVTVPGGTGARIRVQAGGHSYVGEIRANDSYLSSSEPTFHIGLDRAQEVDWIEVKWTQNLTRRVHKPALNRVVRVLPE